jgi:ribosome-binding protein aMBF1 (putative translation factor)
MLERVGIVIVVAGCGGIADPDAKVDAADEAGRVDAIADVAIAEAGDAGPIDMGDCGDVVQPIELADAKYCPYQAGGASTCALGDYCCEPTTGNATCGKPCDPNAGYTVKCSSKNMGCVDGLCGIDAVFERICADSKPSPRPRRRPAEAETGRSSITRRARGKSARRPPSASMAERVCRSSSFRHPSTPSGSVCASARTATSSSRPDGAISIGMKPPPNRHASGTRLAVRALGPRIRHERQRVGWSRYQLAFSAGISVETLDLIESGERPPTAEELKAIANSVGMSVAELTTIATDSKMTKRGVG